MSGMLGHTPAEIIQHALIALGLGSLPESDQAWPVYPTVPSEPEEVIGVTNGTSRTGFRDMVVGLREEKYGVQVVVRAGTGKDAFQKASRIATAMDQELIGVEVELEGKVYHIQSALRGPRLPIGKERDSDRRVTTVNALITMWQVTL